MAALQLGRKPCDDVVQTLRNGASLEWFTGQIRMIFRVAAITIDSAAQSDQFEKGIAQRFYSGGSYRRLNCPIKQLDEGRRSFIRLQ